METFTMRAFGQSEALRVIVILIGESCWFEVMPLPDDYWDITVRKEREEFMRKLCGYDDDDKMGSGELCPNCAEGRGDCVCGSGVFNDEPTIRGVPASEYENAVAEWEADMGAPAEEEEEEEEEPEPDFSGNWIKPILDGATIYDDDMRPEYDFSGGVRGKHAKKSE